MNKGILLAGLMIGFMGCASTAEKQVATELKQEATVKNTVELREEADQLIAKSSFSEKQKSELMELRKSAAIEQNNLREESLKLRALLVKAMIKPDYDKSEVAAIKKSYKKTEDKRVALLFQTVDKANGILGRNITPEAERLFDSMLMNDRTR